MDKTTLVNTDLQAGREVVEQLEMLGIAIDVAAWLQDDETGDWQLVLSSPSLTKPGSKRVYDAVVSILRNRRSDGLDVEPVRILSPHDGVILDLRHRVRTNDRLQEIGLDGLYLGDRSFRAAHIYRVVSNRPTDQKLEYGARVRVHVTGQLGGVQGMIRTPHGPRYLVLHEIAPDDMPADGERLPLPVARPMLLMS